MEYKNPRVFYSLEFKLKIVNYYQKHGLCKTSRDFNVPKTNITRWSTLNDAKKLQSRSRHVSNQAQKNYEALKTALIHKLAFEHQLSTKEACFELMGKHKSAKTILALALKVTIKGYNLFIKKQTKPFNPNRLSDAQLESQIRIIQNKHKGYGLRRVFLELKRPLRSLEKRFIRLLSYIISDPYTPRNTKKSSVAVTI